MLFIKVIMVDKSNTRGKSVNIYTHFQRRTLPVAFVFIANRLLTMTNTYLKLITVYQYCEQNIIQDVAVNLMKNITLFSHVF